MPPVLPEKGFVPLPRETRVLSVELGPMSGSRRADGSWNRGDSALNPELERSHLQANVLPKAPWSQVMVAFLRDGVPVGRALTHSAKSLQKEMCSRSFNFFFFFNEGKIELYTMALNRKP